MKNKEKYIDNIVRYLTHSEYAPEQFKKDTGCGCYPTNPEFEEWCNKEYVEKFRITSFEYEILQLYSRYWILERNINTYHQEVRFRTDGAEDVILPSLISNTYFKFFNYSNDVTSVEMPVKAILENCEVIDRVD